MNTEALLLVLSAALCWGAAQTIAKLGLARMDLVSYASIRAGFALLLIVLYGLLVHGFRFTDWGLVGMAAFAGLIDSFFGTLLYMVAIKRTEAHAAAALSNTAPFWGVTTAVLFLGEPARWVTFAAALLVIIGAYLLITPARADPYPRSLRSGLGALGAAVLWGVGETGPAKYCLAHGMSPVEFQLVLVGTAAASWWALNLGTRAHRRRYLSRAGVGYALFTAVTGFFLGWILWLSGLQLAEASVLTPIKGGAMTLFAFVISIVMLRERPSSRAVLGAALATAGVVLVSLGT